MLDPNLNESMAVEYYSSWFKEIKGASEIILEPLELLWLMNEL